MDGPYKCLNPYSNGLLSELHQWKTGVLQNRLNPYSNGLLSETLAESMLHFSDFYHSTEILTVSQRVSQIRMIFFANVCDKMFHSK